MTLPPLRVIPLGGLGEIGRNMMLLECGDDLIAIDVGLMFPEEEMLGVDLVIPNFSYLREHRDKLKAVFLTHGHEDHVGGLPYFLREFSVPVYSTRLTDGLIRVKLREHKLLKEADLHVVQPGDVIEAGNFSAEFFPVAHSIPDACGIIIRTPHGPVVHTGDFKLDHTPVMDQHTDLIRLAQIGAEGCLLLLADSTYAEEEGHTPSEQVVGESLRQIMVSAEGRVIVATFASLISRVQQIVDAAVFTGRKVFVTGRSMIDNVAMARELGYLTVPDGVIVGVEQMRNIPSAKLTVITTGSQGEPTSALTRMANGTHRHINIEEGDTVILSATPIPGNETAVYRNVDNLYRLGANVFRGGGSSKVHVRGHAAREELKIVQGLVQPEYFVGVHGEYRHLVAHARLAESVGVPKGNAFVMTDGDILEIDEKEARLAGKVDASYVYIDGIGIGDVDEYMLRDRAHLATDGFVVVIVTVDKQTGQPVGQADVLSRGFVDVAGAEELLEGARDVAERALMGADHRAEFGEINARLKDALGKFLYDETRRRPMVLPVTVEV